MNTTVTTPPIIAHPKSGIYSCARGRIVLLKYSPSSRYDVEPGVEIYPIANFMARVTARLEVGGVPFVRVEGLSCGVRFFSFTIKEAYLSKPRKLRSAFYNYGGACSTIYVGRCADLARYLRGTLEALDHGND